jgi:hypothetical protein
MKKALLKNLFLTSTLTLTLTFPCTAQNPWELGGEYMRPMGKGYKSNIIAGRYENFSNKTSFSLGFTYHFSPSDAYGGFNGFGLFAGFRNSFGSSTKGSNPFIGLRVLFSFENFEGKTSLNSLFFTPMAEAGYHFVFGKHLFTTPSVAGGYTLKLTKEYNSRMDDEGGRFVPALATGYRF